MRGRATGMYHIVGTGEYFMVTEDDVKSGKTGTGSS